MSNFDVPATYAPPASADLWNPHVRPVIRPRCLSGMHGDIDVPHPYLAEPLAAVPAGDVRVFIFGDTQGAVRGRPLGGGTPLGAFAFAEPAVLRVGDPVRVDGSLVGHLCGFAGPFVVIKSGHSFCGGELEAGPDTLLEIGGESAVA